MTPNTILLVDHAEGIGGAEQSLLLLLRFLDRRLYRPVLACQPGPLGERARGLGVATKELPMPRLRRSVGFMRDWARGALSLAALAREEMAQVMIANTVRAAVYTAPGARLAGRPFVWYMRDFWLSESEPARPQMDRTGKVILSRSADRIIANSKAVAAVLPEPARVRVVHNGIDLSDFSPPPDSFSFRAAHRIPPEAPVAGMVGRLRPWKGQERFIRMAAIVREAVPETWFVLVGGSPLGSGDGYPDELSRLSKELDLRDRLIFSGHLDDVRPALAAMDVFVHPGDPEPFGLVNLEAMAAGLPVVAFAHGALPEIVQDQETGILVPPGDLAGLAGAVLNLLRDAPRIERLGQAGRRRVETAFRVESTVQGFEEVLEEVLSA